MENRADSPQEPSLVDLAEKLFRRLKLAQQNETETQEEAASLREAIYRIKVENGRLKDENLALRDELFHLRNLYEKQNKVSDEVESLRPTFNQPPHEILRMIFLCALPPSFLLDPSVAGGPESPWCQAMRMKKAIVGVCRTWCKVGIELLYEHVAFRRIGQFPALLNTLQTTSDHLGNLVKGITINCFIPRGYSVLFDTDLKRVFDYCPRVTRVAFTAPFNLPLRHAFPVLNPSITRIEFGSAVEFSILRASLVHISPGLLYLAFHLPNTGIGQPGPSIHFDRLETLRCGMTEDGRHNLPFIETEWSMPRLQHLTFELNGNPKGGETFMAMSVYNSFCAAHGRSLKSLSIQPAYWWAMINYTIEIQLILDLCPVLEHLVLHSNTSTPLTHPTVKWIDIWSPHIRKSDTLPWTSVEKLTQEAFPALQGIRILDGALAVLPDLPIMIPPDAVINGDVFEYRFPGIHIRHDCGRLHRKDVIYMAECENSDSEDEADDSDFVPSEGDNDGGSDSDMCDGSDASCVTDNEDDFMLEDEFYDKDDWEADGETTLTAYLQTLE